MPEVSQEKLRALIGRDAADTVFGLFQRARQAVAPATKEAAPAVQQTWVTVPGKPSEFPPSSHTHQEYLTKEVDPTVPSHVKAITQQNIVRWNDSLQVAGVAGAPLGELVLVPGTVPPAGTLGTATILGEEYGTVIMPDGKEWITRNLDYNSGGFYYAGDPANAAFGRFYAPEVILGLDSLLSGGWHVPTETEANPAVMLPGIPPLDLGWKMAEPNIMYWDYNTRLMTDEYGFHMRGSGVYMRGWFFNRQVGIFAWIKNDLSGVSFNMVRSATSQLDYGPRVTGYYSSYLPVRLLRDPVPADSSISVPAFSVRLFDTPDFLGDAKVFSIPAQEIAAPDEDVRCYLCAQRSGEAVSLVLVPHADIETINGSDIVKVWELEIHEGELHQIGFDNAGDGLPNKQENA